MHAWRPWRSSTGSRSSRLTRTSRESPRFAGGTRWPADVRAGANPIQRDARVRRDTRVRRPTPLTPNPARTGATVPRPRTGPPAQAVLCSLGGLLVDAARCAATRMSGNDPSRRWSSVPYPGPLSTLSTRARGVVGLQWVRGEGHGDIPDQHEDRGDPRHSRRVRLPIMNVRIDTSQLRASMTSMGTKTKRTYNLSPEAVTHVRDLAARGDLAPARTRSWSWRSSSCTGRFAIARRRPLRPWRPRTRASSRRCGARDRPGRRRRVAGGVVPLRWAVVIVDLEPEPSVMSSKASGVRSSSPTRRSTHPAWLSYSADLHAQTRYRERSPFPRTCRPDEGPRRSSATRSARSTWRASAPSTAGRPQSVQAGRAAEAVRPALARQLGSMPPASMAPRRSPGEQRQQGRYSDDDPRTHGLDAPLPRPRRRPRRRWTASTTATRSPRTGSWRSTR